MATDLEHEDVVETAVLGPENNVIITGSRDALIQVRVKDPNLRTGSLTPAKMSSDPDRGVSGMTWGAGILCPASRPGMFPKVSSIPNWT